MSNKKPSVNIPQVKHAQADELLVRFSFTHINSQNEKFSHTNCSTEYFCKLFSILRRFSTWRVGDFVDQNNDEHRHTIDFSQTSEPDGFQLQGVDAEQFGFHEGWQFSVFPEQPWCLWRAHGVLVDDTFYVVWLDPNHLLYPA